MRCPIIYTCSAYVAQKPVGLYSEAFKDGSLWNFSHTTCTSSALVLLFKAVHCGIFHTQCTMYIHVPPMPCVIMLYGFLHVCIRLHM